MARAVVVVGTPVDLEAKEFDKRNGEKGHSLEFKLSHQATALGGSVQCEVKDRVAREQIEAASAEQRELRMVAIPYGIPFVDQKDGPDKGQTKAFVKLEVRAVLTD